jgi:hypothetical protein
VANDGVILGIGLGMVDDVGDVITNPYLAASSSALVEIDDDRGDVDKFDTFEDACSPGDIICTAGLVKTLGTEATDKAVEEVLDVAVDEKMDVSGLKIGDCTREGAACVGVTVDGITKPNLAASATVSSTGAEEMVEGTEVWVGMGVNGNGGTAGDGDTGLIVNPSLAASSIIFLVASSFSSAGEDVETVRAGGGGGAAGCVV